MSARQDASVATPVSPSLISRYHLEDRVNAHSSHEASPIRASWSADAKDRAAGLQERKAQMILQARKRMAERKASEGASTSQ